MITKKVFFSQNLFWCLLNFWQNMSSSRSRLLAINYICIQQQRPVVRYRKCYTTCNPYKSFMASGQILASTFSYKCVIKFNNKITSSLRYSLYQIFKVGKENLKLYLSLYPLSLSHSLMNALCAFSKKKQFSKSTSLQICSLTWNELFDKCGYLGVLLQAASFSYQGL